MPRAAVAHLTRDDPAMLAVVELVGPCRLQRTAGSDLEALVRAIVYQQLSGKAAATIYGRLMDLFPGGRYPSGSAFQARSDTELRGVGLSRAKTLAIRDLCTHVTGRKLPFARYPQMSDEAITDNLVRVRGIGLWSAQMFLMFQLGRLDVWPVGDLGVQKGVQQLRRKRKLPDMRGMELEGRRFAPYGTVAAWYMWRSLDVDVTL